MSSDKSSESLDSLKSLVHQLQAKIERLESQAKQTASDAVDKADSAVSAVKGTLANTATTGGVTGTVAQQSLTPAQHIRMVLMGPPGAGTSHPTAPTGWISALECPTKEAWNTQGRRARGKSLGAEVGSLSSGMGGQRRTR